MGFAERMTRLRHELARISSGGRTLRASSGPEDDRPRRPPTPAAARTRFWTPRAPDSLAGHAALQS